MFLFFMRQIEQTVMTIIQSSVIFTCECDHFRLNAK